MSSTLGVPTFASAACRAHWLDAREHLLGVPLPNQNAWGRYLSASVRPRPIARLPGAGGSGDLFITQGFMARNASAKP
jgi:hypothetical protein